MQIQNSKYEKFKADGKYAVGLCSEIRSPHSSALRKMHNVMKLDGLVHPLVHIRKYFKFYFILINTYNIFS